jgi:Skp family chaperone for outer membrane proteins
MHRRIIPALALAALTISSIAQAAPEKANIATGAAIAAAQPAAAAAQEEYNRKMAAYRKDLAAYEADPGIWTTDIPQAPEAPEGLTAAMHAEKGESR